MYIEPYGLLDIDVLETYIKSLRVPAVTRCIKMTFMAIDSFLENVSFKDVRKDNVISEFQSLIGCSSLGKATLIYNKLSKGKDVNPSELGGVDSDILADFIKGSTYKVLVAPNGQELSDFQSKFVTYLKTKYKGYRRSKHVGVKFILDLIDRSEIQSSTSPYILGRSVEKVMAYQSTSTIIKALNIDDKRDVSSCLGNINNFEEDFLRTAGESNESRIKNLISREPELSHLITGPNGNNLNYLSLEYLKFKIGKIDYKHFNALLGTDISERQMHREFMDLNKKGLIGFNLCTDYLLSELNDHGSNYEIVNFDASSIRENENIKFIVNNLKPLLQYELEYGR